MPIEHKPASPPPARERNASRDKNDSSLERLAREIDPPGREVSNEDLRDPGRMTPKSPTDNRS